MYLFEPSKLFFVKQATMIFYENEFYQNDQAQISTEAFQYLSISFNIFQYLSISFNIFQYLRKSCFLRNTDIDHTFRGKGKSQFSILGREYKKNQSEIEITGFFKKICSAYFYLLSQNKRTLRNWQEYRNPSLSQKNSISGEIKLPQKNYS